MSDCRDLARRLRQVAQRLELNQGEIEEHAQEDLDAFETSVVDLEEESEQLVDEAIRAENGDEEEEDEDDAA